MTDNSSRRVAYYLLGIPALFFMLGIQGLAQQATEQVASDYFNVKQVVPGIWALIVKPPKGSLAVSNATVIELGDNLLVVDSHLSPSAAREAARVIAAITGNKPVRYLVNTHWHPDHVQGNSTYSSAFPGAIDIISHVNTRRDILALEIPFLKDQKIQLPKQIADMKLQLANGLSEGKPMTAEQRRRVEAQLAQSEALVREIANLEITLPTLTLERSMSVYGGDREVRILYFGRGHTEGDVVLYLPREKVLITGDLLTNSIPFMRDAYPVEWSATLAGVETLDYTQNIPGHGDVQQGKERLRMLRAFLDDLIPAVRRAMSEGKTLDQTKQSVKAELAPRHEKNFPSWNGGAEASIERTYNQLKNNGK
ncbi:MAG TPA: MBL fold metallo-hydrolase [Blastocatellia bacterium]|jgi:glyoxylase-like metal-dependent hydrolase (beta-lactamase superfamily II)